MEHSLSILQALIIATVGGGNIGIMMYFLGMTAYQNGTKKKLPHGAIWFWALVAFIFATLIAWGVIIVLGNVVSP